MKVAFYVQDKEDISSLKNSTDLNLENINYEENVKLLIDLETKEVKVGESCNVKMIFSNINQFLTYYDGINIIKGIGV